MRIGRIENIAAGHKHIGSCLGKFRRGIGVYATIDFNKRIGL